MDISVPGLRPKHRKGGATIYYWEPWPAARARGFQPRTLRRPDGTPMDQGEAVSAAQEIVRQLRAIEAGEQDQPRISRGRGFDFSDLIHRYKRSENYRNLAQATRDGYDSELAIIEKEFGDTDVRVFGLADARRYLNTIKKLSRRGGIGRVLRLLLSYAADPEVKMIPVNPMLSQGRNKLKLIPATATRVVECTYEMEAALCASADALDMPMVKLGILAATCTGQRETDILAMSETQRGADGIHRIVQSKRKKADKGPVEVFIPFYLPRLQAALDAEFARRRSGKLPSIEKRWLSNPNTGQAYTLATFSRHFAIVRAHAAKTMLAVAGIQFRDLRDTFITRCTEAECDPIGVCALTGHVPPVIPITWRHYLKMKPGFARRALEKLMAFEAAQGVTMLAGTK